MGPRLLSGVLCGPRLPVRPLRCGHDGPTRHRPGPGARRPGGRVAGSDRGDGAGPPPRLLRGARSRRPRAVPAGRPDRRAGPRLGLHGGGGQGPRPAGRHRPGPVRPPGRRTRQPVPGPDPQRLPLRPRTGGAALRPPRRARPVRGPHRLAPLGGAGRPHRRARLAGQRAVPCPVHRLRRGGAARRDGRPAGPAGGHRPHGARAPWPGSPGRNRPGRPPPPGRPPRPPGRRRAGGAAGPHRAAGPRGRVPARRLQRQRPVRHGRRGRGPQHRGADGGRDGTAATGSCRRCPP